MNELIKELAEQATIVTVNFYDSERGYHTAQEFDKEKFAELIVREMCGLMEQAEDDAYHCFEPSERPTEYIAWLNQWRTRFEEHFGVKE